MTSASHGDETGAGPQSGPQSGPHSGPAAGPTAQPLVSVVIACFQRVDGLGRCLAALAEQTYPNLEVVIVDQTGSDDLARIAAQSTARTRYLRWQPPGPPRRGPDGGEVPPSNASGARNYGVMAAAGELVATTDDDCVAAPDWIESIVAPMRADPAVIMVTGANVIGDSPHDSVSEVRAAGRRHPQLTWNQGGGSSLAFRRDVFVELGGFDMRIGPGTDFPGAEDLHLIYRTLDLAAQRGQFVVGLTGAQVQDEFPTRPLPFVRRYVRYARAYGAVLRREYERRGDVIAREVFRARGRSDLGPFLAAVRNLQPRWVVTIASQYVSFVVGWLQGRQLGPFESDVTARNAAAVRAATQGAPPDADAR